MRGIAAAKDIKIGDKLYEIPYNVVIHRDMAPLNENLSHFKEYLNDLTIYDKFLTLTVFFERIKGNDSFFKPYLDIINYI